jgi:DegV family protein with EDD domain
MKPQLRIVTDTSLPSVAAGAWRDSALEVVPQIIWSGGHALREGEDISHVEGRALLEAPGGRLDAPSVNDFASVFTDGRTGVARILAIMPSRELSSSWANARIAAQQVSGAITVDVVDSTALDAGMDLLVSQALQLAQSGLPADAIVSRIRDMVDRVYTTYYVTRLDARQSGRILAPSHLILSQSIGLAPIVAVDSGRLVVTEKVRNPLQAYERMADFFTEFEDIRDIAVTYGDSQAHEYAVRLIERFQVERPGQHFPLVAMGSLLAHLLGSGVVGVSVLEDIELVG